VVFATPGASEDLRGKTLDVSVHDRPILLFICHTVNMQRTFAARKAFVEPCIQ
jgi:hypothetical protein